MAAPLWRYAGTGQWNDPGMLVHQKSGMTDAQTRTQVRRLTERFSSPPLLLSNASSLDRFGASCSRWAQVNMYAVLPAQLMIGIDIRNASAYLKETLLNKVRTCACE